MKALSIMQPWAWLIVNGYKDVENRDWKPWNPGLRFRGRVLIHAGKKFDKDTSFGDFVLAGRHPITREPLSEVVSSFDMGGIVGVATITDVVTESDSPWFFGRYGLVMKDARPLPFVACKGQLGFFNVPDDAAQRLREIAA